MEHEFAKLLNEFLINEESYIKRIQEDAFTKKNFKFFMSALIHSVYQNDEDNFLKLWCFLIVNDLADIQYLFFASNINFIQRIKKQFDEFFRNIKIDNISTKNLKIMWYYQKNGRKYNDIWFINSTKKYMDYRAIL